MKKVITYGTFDLLHYGHINLLKRAKALGDYLIVGVTSESYDYSRGKLNVCESLVKRIENVRNTGYADEIIVEEYLGQKIEDIQKYNIDTFAIGSDWIGKFDYLKEYCEVVYLERTKNISSTELRMEKNKIINLGIVGNGRIASRFIRESKYVSGVTVDYVFGRNEQNVKAFVEKQELAGGYTNYSEFLSKVDSVYIATPHTSHYAYAKQALCEGKHVLCEKPMVLTSNQAIELYEIAEKNNCILYNAIKTAYAPCFTKLINIAKSGLIGRITDITASFTKLIEDKSLREYNINLAGGSVTELSPYPLLAIIKLLGVDYKKVEFKSIMDEDTGVDSYTKINIEYDNAFATANIGIGAKREGDLVIAGTSGYIYVPAPWWKTEYFEVRYENLSNMQRFFAKFEGDGLRYEIAEFISSINTGNYSYKLTKDESIAISRIIELFLAERKTN